MTRCRRRPQWRSIVTELGSECVLWVPLQWTQWFPVKRFELGFVQLNARLTFCCEARRRALLFTFQLVTNTRSGPCFKSVCLIYSVVVQLLLRGIFVSLGSAFGSPRITPKIEWWKAIQTFSTQASIVHLWQDFHSLYEWSEVSLSVCMMHHSHNKKHQYRWNMWSWSSRRASV